MKIIHRFLLISSLFVTVFSFGQNKSGKKVNHAAHKPTVQVEQKVISEDAFLKKHTNVQSITWQPGYIVTLTKTDGSKETYRLDNRADEKKFVAAYGQILRQKTPVKNSGN